MTAPISIDHPKVMPEPNSGCWLWFGAIGGKGHGQVRRKGKCRGAHVLAWEDANGPITNGLWALHKCNVANCVNPAHIYLGTHADNMRDMKTSGRRRGRTLGERSGKAKLTKDIVLSLRSRRAAGERYTDLAREHGLTRSCVRHAVIGLNWGHL